MTNAVTLRNSLLLAPLLGVTGSLVNALSWGLMLLTVVVAYAVAMRGLRPRLTESLRLPASVVLAATFTGCADLALQLHSLPLHHSLGFYPGLIGLQCVVLEMNGFFIHDTLRHRLRLLGLSACLLLLLGAVRELLGSGSLGNHWGWLAGCIDRRLRGAVDLANGRQPPSTCAHARQFHPTGAAHRGQTSLGPARAP